jgi:DNA-binding CsgD family transcriptional regulator
MEVDRSGVRITGELLKPPGGSPRATVEITLAILQTAREAMAICGRSGRAVATNSAFRQLQAECGASLDILINHAIADDVRAEDVVDDGLGLVGRATPVNVDGAFQMFVVAISDLDSSGSIGSHTVRIVRDSLERALQAIGEAEPTVFHPYPALTRKEDEVFRLLVGGLRVSSIARTLHVSESTVRSHLKSIFRKSGVHSQVALFEKLHASHLGAG